MKAVVKTWVTSLMTKPCRESVLTDEVLSGYVVDILEDNGEWLRILTHYNYEGWINLRDIITDTEFVENWEKGDKYTVSAMSPTIDVLSEPRVQGYLITQITKGCYFKLINFDVPDKPLFCEVETSCGKGFLKKQFLEKTIPSSNYTDKTDFRERIVKTAESYLGTQYRWGGKSLQGIDCSGLCAMAYLLNGVTIFRDAEIRDGFPVKPISRVNLKMGDLIFFPGHVGMYIENGRYIHSSTKNNGVYYNSLSPESPDYNPIEKEITVCGSIFI